MGLVRPGEALVDLHDTSNAVFQQQQDAIDAIVAQLDALQAGVDTDYASYNAGYDSLNADIADFNSRADAGEFTSQAQFTAERNALQSAQLSRSQTAGDMRGGGGKYVMRGGFRMPKAQLSPEISSMLEPNYTKRLEKGREDVIAGKQDEELSSATLPALGDSAGRRPGAATR